MKPLLATIFLAGVTSTFIWRLPIEPYPLVTGDCYGKKCTIHVHSDERYCPWWIDPELWWNRECTGGLPPQLPVPEGLR